MWRWRRRCGKKCEGGGGEMADRRRARCVFVPSEEAVFACGEGRGRGSELSLPRPAHSIPSFCKSIGR